MAKKRVYVNDVDAVEYMRAHLTDEERAIADFQTRVICELIDARKEAGISQRQLAELTEMQQPTIAKIEKEITCPQIKTLIKMLLPLGKTLSIVPIPNHMKV